jgi:hypothetical protein
MPVKVYGANALVGTLRRLDLNGRENVHRVVEEATVAVQAGAKARAPRLSGALIRSIKRSVDSSGYVGRVYTRSPYAATIEFGRRSGRGGPRPPRPFLFPAFEAYRNTFRENLSRALKSSIPGGV